jgi:hypothetical protein
MVALRIGEARRRVEVAELPHLPLRFYKAPW